MKQGKANIYLDWGLGLADSDITSYQQFCRHGWIGAVKSGDCLYQQLSSSRGIRPRHKSRFRLQHCSTIVSEYKNTHAKKMVQPYNYISDGRGGGGVNVIQKNLLFAQNQKINDADGFLDDDQQWAWWNYKLYIQQIQKHSNKVHREIITIRLSVRTC